MRDGLRILAVVTMLVGTGLGWNGTAMAAGDGGQEFKNSVAMFNKGKIKDALDIWMKMAEANNPDAFYRIGYLNHLGYGRFYPQSYTEAAKWYQKAADIGHAQSQNSLASLYETGRGVAQDLVLAYMWSSLAAKQGFLGASKNRDQIAKKLTPAKLKLAKKLVHDWVPVEVELPK